MANIQLLLDKMTSVDKDLRYMACSDLIPELQKPEVKFNERVEQKVWELRELVFVFGAVSVISLFSCLPRARPVAQISQVQLVQQLLKLLEDVNGEVQTMAVKW
jgi:cullin-associated NEDD8-dissociated protein 1